MASEFDNWKIVHRGTEPEEAVEAERLRFLSNGYAVPSYFVKNQKFSNRLLVLLNGAVQREKGRDPREVFQRRSWIEDFESNVLILADATIHPENGLRIGWSQGNGTASLELAMANCVDYFRNGLGVMNEDIVFFGSSAGGFQAVALHAYFKGSRFLVNNAQFDWTRYHKSAVEQAVRHSFGAESVEDVRRDYSERCNVFERYLRRRLPIDGVHMVNVSSREDYQTQLPVLQNFLKRRSSTQSSVPMSVTVEYYADPRAGHMPRSRQFTVGRINSMLREAGDIRR